MLNLAHVDRPALEDATLGILKEHFLRPPTDLASAIVQSFLDALAVTEARQAPGDPEGRDRHVTSSHVRVLYLLAESQGSTDTALCRRWTTKVARALGPWPFIADAGIRSRRAELVRWGLVEHSGGWGRTLNGRRSRIWQLRTPQARPVELPPLDASGREAIGLLLPEAAGDLVQLQLLGDLDRYDRLAVHA